MNMIIGIDFDNTIVSYADIMHKMARQWGYIDANIKKNKKEIRDAVRQVENGEVAWHRLQAFVYGKAMEEAVLFEGVKDFFCACKNAAIPLYIISHKTQTLEIDAEGRGTDLRKAAFDWMQNRKFFEKDGLGFSRSRVYFESTIKEKIERIKELKCTHFIDDLEEIFLEKSFPNIQKILFGTNQKHASSKAKILNTWEEINEYFFEKAQVIWR